MGKVWKKSESRFYFRGKTLTVQDVRAFPGLSSRVDAQLHQLDEERKQNGRNDRAKRGKKLRSGKTAKLTSRVLYPQVWPQSQLSLAYVSKAVPYDNLTLAEFASFAFPV